MNEVCLVGFNKAASLFFGELIAVEISKYSKLFSRSPLKSEDRELLSADSQFL